MHIEIATYSYSTKECRIWAFVTMQSATESGLIRQQFMSKVANPPSYILTISPQFNILLGQCILRRALVLPESVYSSL